MVRPKLTVPCMLLLLLHMQPQEAGCVQAAACGSNHSVLLTNSGAVYTAGCNSSGQCGQDKELQEVSSWLVAHLDGMF